MRGDILEMNLLLSLNKDSGRNSLGVLVYSVHHLPHQTSQHTSDEQTTIDNLLGVSIPRV